jgi:hypothetical protein
MMQSILATTLARYAPGILLCTRLLGIRKTAEHYSHQLRTQIPHKAIRGLLNAIKLGRITVTREQLEKVAESDPTISAWAKSNPELLNPEVA